VKAWRGSRRPPSPSYGQLLRTITAHLL
jgi:hypothetical protein